MIYGYAGTILRVNLSSNTIAKEPLSQELIDSFIGGRGFVSKILYDELPPKADPFSEKNMLIIATGPLSGSFLPASGKTHFGTKSPATGGFGDSNMGGHFGPALKYAGYDVLIITGISNEPCYLSIENEKVEIRSADKYWGQGAIIAEKMLKDDLGEDFHSITIGPAGENRVNISCISHDFGRQAGRTGVAAVMGSKRLKAVSIKGTGGIPVFDIEGLYKKGKEAYKEITEKPGFLGWTPQGTAGITDWCNEAGAFPTKNFQTSYSEHYKDINGQAILDKLKITDKGCFGCPTPCGKYGYTKTKMGSAYVEGPEYETIALLGGNCYLKTIQDVAYANYICDELGLDTISGGLAVSWAIECFEKGILTKEDIGKEIQFGDLESVIYLLNKIGYREGIGDLLADGVKSASEKTGQESEKFAIHVKGLEWSGYECRNAPGMMLAYMTADIGAHHSKAWVLGHDVAGSAANVHDLISAGAKADKLPKSTIDGKAEIVINSQHTRPSFDLLGICRLQYMELGFEVEYYEEFFHLMTGKRVSWEELRTISEKIWNLNRCFNFREIDDYGREYDYPPARFYEEPIPNGPNEGHLIIKEELDLLLDDYYQLRGWSKDGIPTKETLARLGILSTVESTLKSNNSA